MKGISRHELWDPLKRLLYVRQWDADGEHLTVEWKLIFLKFFSLLFAFLTWQIVGHNIYGWHRQIDWKSKRVSDASPPTKSTCHSKKRKKEIWLFLCAAAILKKLNTTVKSLKKRKETRKTNKKGNGVSEGYAALCTFGMLAALDEWTSRKEPCLLTGNAWPLLVT